MRRLSLKVALAEPKYQCCYCGRTFIDKLPHKCKDGFRKKKLKFVELIKECKTETIEIDTKNN